ncbi:MAG: 50S ribosomal protein L37e [Candidatus Aenigmarchaeota archaeon]|nr:50S ribosomal protein L37e [Candidatus Aenigmarchaeota archaeon]
MSKGTPSFGKHQKRTHVLCRRCGRRSFHIRKRRCSACGFGESSKIREYAWQNRDVRRNRKR